MSQNEHSTPQHDTSPNERGKELSRRKLILGGMAGLVSVGAAGVGVGAALSRKAPEFTPAPVDKDPKPRKPVEREPEVDPYEAQSWGGIDPELEGEDLIEALSIPESATPEEAANKFTSNINYLLMGGCTPEEAQKYANLDPQVYLMDEEFVSSLMAERDSKKKAVVDASYDPDIIDEYTYDTPFEITNLGDSQAFNNLMASAKIMYCISYNDETASEPYKLQFEPIHTEVNDDGSASILINVVSNLDKSGDSVNELMPQYIEEGVSYDLTDQASIYTWLEVDEASGQYKVSQPAMELVQA